MLSIWIYSVNSCYLLWKFSVPISHYLEYKTTSMFWDWKSGTLIIIFLLGVFMLYQVVDRSPPFAIKPSLYESIFGYIVIIQGQDSWQFLKEWRWWWGGHNNIIINDKEFSIRFFLFREWRIMTFSRWLISAEWSKHEIKKLHISSLFAILVNI